MAWITGGAVVGGALIGALSSRSAARTQAGAGQAAIDEQRREFDVIQNMLAPWRIAGAGALGQLTSMTQPGGELVRPFNFDISQDPGYQFRLSEGQRGVESSAAARGTQLSGATLKELMRYGQDYASGEFNSAFARDLQTKTQKFNTLASIAGIGQQAVNTTAQAGTAASTNISNTITGIGNAQAAGLIGQGNAIGGALGGLGNTMLLSQILGRGQTPLGPAGGDVTYMEQGTA